MEILTVLALAAASTASALLFLKRLFCWRTILKYAAMWDVIITALLMLIFAGTLGGTLVAVMTGLLLSLALYAAKGADRLRAAIVRALS